MALTSPALVKASNLILETARGELAKAKLFATDISSDFAEPTTTVKVAVVSGGAMANFDATSNDYENEGAAGVTYVPVTLNTHVKGTFSYLTKELVEANSALVGRIAGAMKNALAAKLDDTLIGLIAGGTATSVFAAVSKKNLAGLRTVCNTNGMKPRETILVLSNEKFNDVLAELDSSVYGGTEAIRTGIIEGLYGFKAAMAADITGCTGALVHQDALVIAGRAIPQDPDAWLEYGVETDEASGLAISTHTHFSGAKGKYFVNVEALFGGKVVQPTKIVKLTATA